MSKLFSLFALLLILTAGPLSVFAEPVIIGSNGQSGVNYDTAGLCGGDPLSSLFCSTTLPEMLNTVFQLAISVGAVLALLRIAYAGYLYMGSADMWSTKQGAKDVFRDAVIGLLLLLSVWLVLYQINPCLLDLSALSPGTGSSACSSK